jgi:hypothetical protein
MKSYKPRLVAYGGLAAVLLALTSKGIRAQQPPVIPVGLDPYRMWEHWPYQRIGARTYLRSTYDRRGGNEGADASHFLYQLRDDFNVTLDLEGQGVLYFARYNHWHGSPWHFVVDGTDSVIQESSTADPNRPVANSVFLPQRLFPSPLALTWSATQGADLSWVPVGFERSFQMAYSRTHYGTGYYIYQQYVPGARLSQPIRSWGDDRLPDRDVLDLIERSGTDIVPAENTPEGKKPAMREEHGEVTVPSHGMVTLANLTGAPSMLRVLALSVPRESAVSFGRAWLRVTWDGRQRPSVDAPVALFYGAGTLYNRDGREYLVKAFPVSVRYSAQRVYLACYFPMPFFRSARFELKGDGTTPVAGIRWNLRYQPYDDAISDVAYFHATYRDYLHPESGKDLVLLGTRETEGGRDWSGQLVGTSWIFSHRAEFTTLEGDPRFFFDDSQTPQVQGTGTEEWGGGGDYWGERNMTLPFAGHPVGAPSEKAALNDEDKIESAYRFLLGDLMPFGKNAVIRLEHGGEDESTEHYEAVTCWYGAPAPSLVKTDELDVGRPESERPHHYWSSQASEPVEIMSRYEWGVDTLNGKEIYPAHLERGRYTTGTSEFTLKLTPNNFGVLLRRTLDYSFPNQRAEVYVADRSPARTDSHKLRWQRAGVWYLAGSNTCVYSNPKEELGATERISETSNRRFRDDEFLVPLSLTRGRSVVRIRIRFTPVRIPLFPGAEPPKAAWSEIRYYAYCFVIPSWQP